MKSRLLIFGIVGLIGLIAVGAVAWYLISPLFIDDVVDEAFPFEAPTAGELAAMTDDERAATEVSFMDALPDEAALAALSADEMAQVEAKVMDTAAMVMMDKDVQDEMMDAEWVVAGQGQFVGADSFHQGSGQATIFRQGDMSVLRFEDFMVTNGPDLHVLLATSPSPTGRADLGDYIDLGSLKGNLGNQNYEIPSDVDLSQYKSVVIYCMPFHVLFAAATIG